MEVEEDSYSESSSESGLEVTPNKLRRGRSGSNSDTNGDCQNLVKRICLNSVNSTNVTLDESGIFLKTSPQNRITKNFCSDYDDSEYDVSDNEASDIENLPHSTPKARPTTAKRIKLKIPLNIFKIDVEKVDRAIDKQNPAKMGKSKTNAERIDFMIDTANPKRKRKRKQNTSVIKDLSNIYVKQQYNGYFDSSNDFELLLYRKYTYKRDEETGDRFKKLHKIRFLHRGRGEDVVDEIFALPSGSGRCVVLQWADTNFPLSVASAILDGESVTGKEVKNLFDNRYLSKFKMKKGESLNATSEFHLRFAPRVYTKFHADVKIGFDDIKKILGFTKGSEVTMQVQLEAILFPNAVIDINNYSELCGKLSEIDCNPNLKRSTGFNGYLSKVSKVLKEQLNNLLHQELEQFFRMTSRPDDETSKLKHFFITQKDSTKYFKAEKFQIFYKKKLVKIFFERPQLHDLHPIINKHFTSNGFTSFVKGFDALQICTPPPTNGEKIVKETLINCLEGTLYDDRTEKSYWKVGSDWYEVSYKYTFDIFAEYIRILNESLLQKKDCSLRIPWPLIVGRKRPVIDENDNQKKIKRSINKYKGERYVYESDYNAMYENVPYFINTDAVVAPFGIEICDLFQFIPHPVNDSKIHLHHVKKVFNADGYRVAICQILSSAWLLYESLQKCDNSEESAAFKLFAYVKKFPEKFPDTYPCSSYKYKEFLEHLRNATFVFSPLFQSGSRELDTEDIALLKYDFNDFKDEIEPESRERLKKELKSFLTDSEYIHPNGRFTQKWYDTCAVARDGGFKVKNTRSNNTIDPFPKTSKMSPQQLRKILKKKYYRTIEGLSVKQLIVNVSEGLRNMGFGFKICQIEGEPDDLLPNDA